jgi:uncharacterized protein YaiE (UPF0345 family)
LGERKEYFLGFILIISIKRTTHFDITAISEALELTSPSFCTSANERVHIATMGCEIEFGGAQELQTTSAGDL